METHATPKRIGGHPQALTAEDLAAIRQLYENGIPVRAIAQAKGVSTMTVWRRLREPYRRRMQGAYSGPL